MQHQETEEATRAYHFEGTSAATLYSLLRVQPLAHSETELRRRRWLLAWFLLRDPFYRALFWYVAPLCVQPDTAGMASPS